jgi:hypothetical protein
MRNVEADGARHAEKDISGKKDEEEIVQKGHRRF